MIEHSWQKTIKRGPSSPERLAVKLYHNLLSGAVGTMKEVFFMAFNREPIDCGGQDCDNCSDERIAGYASRVVDRVGLVVPVRGSCERMAAAICDERRRRGDVESEEYGRGHPFHDLPEDERISRAIGEALRLRRATPVFPQHINTNWLYGWTMLAAWTYADRLEEKGTVPTAEVVRGMFEEERLAMEREDQGMAANKGNALQVFGYEGKEIRTALEGGEVWVAAKDVCEALEYNLAGGISKYIAAVPEEWKGGKRISTLGGKQKMLCLSEQGLYFFLARSDKPKALPFQKWIAGEVLPAIRKTGEYATPKAQKEKADKNDQLARKRLEVMEKNANWRMVKLIIEGMNVFADVMTEESRTVFMAKYGELVAQTDLKHILPKATEKWYSATEIGKECGASPSTIGRVANINKLKAPEGESGEFGTWIRSKSQHSSREVMTFVYNEKGRRWFMNYFGVLADATGE